MPDLGDTIEAQEIGLNGRRLHVWAECPTCLNRRWTAVRTLDNGTNRRCQACVRAALKKSFKVGKAQKC